MDGGIADVKGAERAGAGVADVAGQLRIEKRGEAVSFGDGALIFPAKAEIYGERGADAVIVLNEGAEDAFAEAEFGGTEGLGVGFGLRS